MTDERPDFGPETIGGTIGETPREGLRGPAQDPAHDPGLDPPSMAAGAAAAPRPRTRPAGRPEGLPEKFWDADRGRVRTDALYASYRELERRAAAPGDRDIPDSHEKYQIDAPLPGMSVDPEVNARLHEAGFTQRQAQLVYDLAAEYLGPLSENVGSEVAAEMAAMIDRRRLCEHFGGERRWNETAKQLETWGRANLGDKAVDELSTSYEGVLRLHAMMRNDEPSLTGGADAVSGGFGEAALKELMRDPRYWRDHDPAYVRKIKDGFEALYPEPE